MLDKAKSYSNIRYAMAIVGIVYNFILVILFLRSGLSVNLVYFLEGHLPPPLVLPFYLLTVLLSYFFLDFPVSFYGSFILEHKFSLSTQELKDWFLDQLKSGLVFYLVILILITSFYYILKISSDNWWLIVSFFWILFSVFFAKIMPVIIIPLFFKYKKLSDDSLRERIMKLAEKMKVKILDCFEIDFSKKTLKANAAFVGIGNTRRVILADTLKDKYSHDEIEVILAHEFAHYQRRHLLKLITINALSTLAVFFLIFKTSSGVLNFYGFSSLGQFASLPVVFLYFMIFSFIMQPLEAFISRCFEREADRIAIQTTGLKGAFVSMMNKLADQNLADRNPHPIIKFLFLDHPPIDERINSAS